MILARTAFHLATVDPQRARQMGGRIEQNARRTGDWAAVSVALHAIGAAAKLQSDLTGSEAALRKAVTSARRAGSVELAAEARTSMAGTLILSGRAGQALRMVASAVADLDGVAAAKARTQQAALLQLVGRDDEALAVLREALPVLKRSGEHEWTARALSNRSLLHIRRRSFRLAEVDLLAAQRLCADHRLTSWAAYVEHNLGWLKVSAGEVVAALEYFERAETLYVSAGSAAVGALQEGKARLLLSLRLVEEARAAAEAAVATHEGQQRKLQAADAHLLVSTVAAVQGDFEVARTEAMEAKRGFHRLNRATGVTLANWATVQSRLAADPSSVATPEIRRCAEQLAVAGWPVPALDARLIAGQLGLARGQRRALIDLADAASSRSSGPAEARARGWLAEAVLRDAQGRRPAAKRALDAGLRVLETHQATLGATELRAHYSSHRNELALTGLRWALVDRDARRVLSFVERGRATATALRSPRPPADPVLSADLADLRATMMEMDGRRSAGRPTDDLVQRQVRLERSVADRCRRFPAAGGSGHSNPRRLSDLVAAMDDRALVEFVEIDGRLHVVTLVEGKARLRGQGSIQDLQRKLPVLLYFMRRMVSSAATSAGLAAAVQGMRQIRSELQNLLLGGIEDHLGDRELVIVPSASLRAIPWSLLPALTGRPVAVAPSARVWLAASDRATSRSLQVAVVAGPGLPGAISEARAVAGMYPNSTCLIGSDGTTSSVTAAMDGAIVVHIAAHGILRSDNPFFSALLLADGPLTLYELERLDRAPYHVVLAACEAASPSVVAQDELLGFASMLLSQGTTSLIAPVNTVVDGLTADFMLSYHRHLQRGLAPTEALSSAQQKAFDDGDAAWATATSFVCIGTGHQSLAVAQDSLVSAGGGVLIS